MPGRQNVGITGAETYRYAYNGMETDPEVSGNGNSINFDFRRYNPRLGRWFSHDPLKLKYPSLTPYQMVANNPILNKEVDGRDWIITTYVENGTKYVRMSFYGAVINGTGKVQDMELFAELQRKGINLYAGEYIVEDNPEYSKIVVTVHTSIRVINDVNERRDHEHLTALVSTGHHMTETELDYGRVNRAGGRVAYINSRDVRTLHLPKDGIVRDWSVSQEVTSETIAHELGHTLTLRHIQQKRMGFLWLQKNPNYASPPEGLSNEELINWDIQLERSNNMGMNGVGDEYTTKQIETILESYEEGKLNRGSNKAHQLLKSPPSVTSNKEQNIRRTKYDSSNSSRNMPFCSDCDL